MKNLIIIVKNTKNKNKMKKPTEHSNDIVNDIMKCIKMEGDKKQIKLQMMPFISNAIFHRDKELLEMERFVTLITLCRVLDDKNIKTVIDAMGYSLIIRPRIEK